MTLSDNMGCSLYDIHRQGVVLLSEPWNDMIGLNEY